MIEIADIFRRFADGYLSAHDATIRWSRREHAAQARLLLELQRPAGADVPSSETSDHTADRPGEPAATAERRACPCCKQGYLTRIRRLYPKQAGGP